MTSMAELARAVERAFARTAAGLDRWPDPHPGRSPLEEEYSRVSDPARWRIVPARAEAWCEGAVEAGIATLERDVDVRWADERGAAYRRVDRLVPRVDGGLPLVLAYASFAGEELTGVTLGIGDPAVVVGRAPACGCDACDSGSEAELEELDAQIRTVVTGRLRHLTDGARTIVTTPHGWSASGSFGRRTVERVLADPRGWDELSGPGWLDDD